MNTQTITNALLDEYFSATDADTRSLSLDLVRQYLTPREFTDFCLLYGIAHTPRSDWELE